MMTTDVAILIPVFALAFWTFAVLNVVGYSRIRAATKGLVAPADFRLGESDRVPENVRLANRNYMNLLELPVLFYTVCIVIHVTAIGSGLLTALAWLYVGLRVVHSVIHLNGNRVMPRLFAFVASNVTLLAVWILAAVALAHKGAL